CAPVQAPAEADAAVHPGAAYSCPVGSIAPGAGGQSGGVRPRRISQRQNAQPDSMRAAASAARCSGSWLTSGEITPAISALSTSPAKACSDEAEPRWRGYMSRMASVTIGNTSAMPKALSTIGSTAQGTLGCDTAAL